MVEETVAAAETEEAAAEEDHLGDLDSPVGLAEALSGVDRISAGKEVADLRRTAG